MLAHVRQGLLHHVQDLHLNVRRQRHALAFDVEVGGQPCLVLELLQGLSSARCDVFRVGAGAEMNQQLAHVAQALVHARVEFNQRLLDAHRIGAADVAAQQPSWIFRNARLWAMESCSSRAMKLRPRPRRSPAAGPLPKTLDGAGQVAGDRLQQDAVFVGQRSGIAVEEVDLADQALMQADGHADDGLRSPRAQ